MNRSVPLPIAILSIAESFWRHPAMAVRMHRPSCAISGTHESRFWRAIAVERNRRRVKGVRNENAEPYFTVLEPPRLVRFYQVHSSHPQEHKL
jgi:hypothetical protein